MSLLAPDCKIRGKGRGHALELDVDEGDFAARRKAVGLAEFLAAHGLLRARRGWICGRSSAAASLCSPTVVCLQQVAARLLGEPRATTINGPPPVGLPLRQKAKGGAAALEGRLAGVEWGVLAALAA